MKRTVAVIALLSATAVPLATAPAAHARGSVYDNCTAFNKKYPHGVGRDNAHDHTSGTPVRSFKHSTSLYNTAMNHNSRLDGDKDGIACEKA